uniref:Tripartite motif-containing protein 16-like n=1 Tax=Salmo trutta TaxID=8032 RepID=A0A673XX27_SALTR
MLSKDLHYICPLLARLSDIPVQTKNQAESPDSREATPTAQNKPLNQETKLISGNLLLSLIGRFTMAEAHFADMDLMTCSICLDLLKDPVTTACGHSYCMGCIKESWDQDDLKGVYRCPQCRQTFIPRPVLNRSTVLAELVEKLKKTGLQAAPPPALCYAGPGDVACDSCTGRKLKAVKSCLMCLASYCDTHLKLHNDLNRGKKHKLIDATGQLQEKICSHHDKLLEVYCRTDQQCICYLCTMDEHKGHDTVSAAAERTEKQRQLGMSQQKVQQRFQEREKELKSLQKAVKSLKISAQSAVEDSDKIFTELIRSIERRRSEVKELIRAQEKAQVSQAEGLLEQLKQEIAELRKRSTELEQLSHTEDHIHFFQSYQSLSLCLSLQSYQSLSSISVSSDLPSIVVRPLQYFGDVSKTVSELREKLEDFLKGEWTKISTTVNIVDVVLPPEPKTREQLLQYSCQLTLDPNTAHTHLSLSEGNRKVTYTDQVQPYPDHPDRFTNYNQVLCREGLSGRCYWEVEWSGVYVITAVSYKDISRTETCSRFGFNNKSWGLQCSRGGYCFRHNNVVTKVSGPQSSRVGVDLDHKAGTLSFYSVSDTMTLLHRVQTTFTQPLYPGFWLSGTAELVKL